jgi:hypothetical protein
VFRVAPLLLVACAWLWSAPAIASGAEGVYYLREVKPLLLEKCGACHGAVRQKSGLRLDAGKLVHQGGENGPVLVPGKSAESLLIKKLTAADGESLMPPEGEGKPLTSAEIDLLRRWIDAGAKYPADETIAADPRDHWSFKPPIKSTLPSVKNPRWVRNPIDTFIAAKLDEQKLSPADEADRATLLRRVYLDLIGLPPTRDELHAFLADKSSTAYERVVDQLLDRPEHGERWGRHWMDVWRYCDWHGSSNEIRYSQRHLWRWRDWIVRSLNADKGYDRMIVEMLAGDEVAPDDPDIAAATGFIGRNWYKFDRNVWMRELVEHTAVGFLGTTLKCARCHDHKFDPISQEEYYRFRAFFEPHHVRTDRVSAVPEFESFTVAGESILKDGVARIYDKTLDAPTYLFERGDDRYPRKDQPLTPGVPKVLGGRGIDVQPVSLPLASYAPMLRPAMLAELSSVAEQKVVAAEQAWRATTSDALLAKRLEHARADRRATRARIAADVAKHIDRAEKKRVDELAVIAARHEREAAAIQAETAVIEAEQALKSLQATPPVDDKAKQALSAAEKKVADARKSLDTASANLKKTDGQYTPLGEVYPTTSTGRRLALARWIADGQNPRTARVAVNQMWLRHFGRPIVATVADFGLRSKPPTHPELLDWLAVELVDHGWSMKHVHRLIVTSATYRQKAESGKRNAEEVAQASNQLSAFGSQLSSDTDNLLLARMNSRRLEAEAVRDSVLFIAGSLDTAVGGREIPYSQDQTVPRRSMYFQTAPNRQSTMMELFDAASTEECYDRKPSVIPQQSLALLNSSMTANASRRVAARHAKRTEGDFVVAVFEEILSRAPTQAESARCVEFLQSQSRWLADTKSGPTLPASTAAIVVADPVARARENLVLVLFNHNDFVTVR